MTDKGILTLYAPVSGKTVDIGHIPDPVFSAKTLGDGISIAPTSFVLCAPCAGRITTVHSARHALTMTANDGVVILLHIGLDTVMLKGNGFKSLVSAGQKVVQGQELIAFDKKTIEGAGKNLLTEIVIPDSEQTEDLTALTGRDVVAGRDPVLKVRLKGKSDAPSKSAFVRTAESWEITVRNPAGVHARPAAVLVSAAKAFESEIKLIDGEKSANAKSLVGVMGMDIRCGDKVRIRAVGRDAADVMKKLMPLIESGLGEDLTKPVEAASPAVGDESKTVDGVFYGVPASAGKAVGIAVRLEDVSFDVEEFGGQISDEKAALTAAVAEAKSELVDLRDKTARTAGTERAAIFDAHLELLDDPELFEKTEALIEHGRSAAFAWQQTVNERAAVIGDMKNPLLAARAADMHDVGRRVLRLLTGEKAAKRVLPAGAVLIARDIPPSEAATLDRDKVAGIATTDGGAGSHASILARALLLPAVTGLPEGVLNIVNGTPVLIDGTRGFVKPEPSDGERAEVAAFNKEEKEKRDLVLQTKDLPAVSTDGVAITIAGNIANLEETDAVVSAGGEGVGLLRSEFLFSGRNGAPGEDKQTEMYGEIKRKLGNGRTLIVRTLDIGGDKPLPYLPTAAELNPFLGVRGIRFSLAHEALFRSQIRAVLRANAENGGIRLMFPMIAVVDELKEARAVVEEERKRLNVPPVETGMMVEVPSAALTAEAFARYVDFFSIGTNDLTQYVLAMDRGNPALRPDGLAPAVLRAVKMTADGAAACGKWTGVCGALAAEPIAVPLLVGAGVTELSVPAASIPVVKDLVRKISVADCRALTGRALRCETAAEVRKEADFFLQKQQ